MECSAVQRLSGMGELEVARQEKLQLGLLTTTWYGEAQDLQKKQGSSGQYTSLTFTPFSCTSGRLAERGNIFSAFSFIFLRSSVHPFYHVTSMKRMAQRLTIFSCTVLWSVTCLRCAWELCCYTICDFLGILRTWSFCSNSTDIRTEGTWLIKQLHSHKIKDRKMHPDVSQIIYWPSSELVKGSDCSSCCILT